MSLPKTGGFFIDWDENGNPVPRYAPIMSNQNLESLLRAALSFKYVPTADDHEDLQNNSMTCGEVMAWRMAQGASQGDVQKAQFITDRIMGRPTQKIEQRTDVSITVQDFVQQRVEQLKAIGVDLEQQYIDVQPIIDYDLVAGL
jgi:hypothetical protein